MSVAQVLENMYSVSELSRGKASAVLAAVTDNSPAIIVKNNKPYRVVMTVEEYKRIMEHFEDEYLLELAEERLSKHNEEDFLEWDDLLRKCDLDPNDPLDDIEVEFE